MEHTPTTEPDAAPLAVKAAGFVADRIRLAEHDLPWNSVEIDQVLIPMPVTDPDLEAADGGYASRLPARFGLGADGHIASLVPGDRSIRAARVQARRSVIFADAPADAGADLVVRTLDEVSRPALAEGRLALKTEG